MTTMLLEWVFTSMFLILTVLVLRAVFGRRVSARLRYALWAVVLMRLLVPVQLFSFPFVGTQVFPNPSTGQSVADRPVQSAVPSIAPGEEALGLPVTEKTPGNVPAPPAAPEAPEPPAAPDLTKAPAWLGWIWLGGSAAMALVLAASNLRFARCLRRRRIPLETDCPLPVYAAVGLPSPCLFGLVRPGAYVTPEAASDPVMLRHVIAHEYTHFRHGDHLWSFLRCAALAAHWWNPLVWLAVVLSRRDGELACDEGALALLGDGERLAYGNTLLALVTARPGPGDLLCFATTMAGEKKSLKERVSRIACAPKRILWAALAVVLVTALACVCAFGQGVEPDKLEDDGPLPTETQAVAASPAPNSEQQADLNRNGIPETLRVSGSDEEMRLEVWEDGELIFSEEAHHAHAGYNALFLYTLDGEDYLLRYNPYMQQGWCDYSCKLFTLSADGEEQAVQEKQLEFCINLESPMVFGGPNDGSFEPEKIAAFMDEVNALLASSVQLINTDAELLATFQDAGRLVDDLWWLDIWEPAFTRDPSRSLLENLRDFQAAMEVGGDGGYASVLLGKSKFILYENEPPISIDEALRQFDPNDTLMKYWSFAVVDMDRDGMDEVLVYACGVSGDMGGYLLLDQQDGEVHGTVFNAQNNWSNRWFQELKTDGTFRCADSLGGAFWRGVSRLIPSAAGGWSLYSMAVYETTQSKMDLESFMSIEQRTTEKEFETAVAAQDAKPDAVWYEFNEDNILSMFLRG